MLVRPFSLFTLSICLQQQVCYPASGFESPEKKSTPASFFLLILIHFLFWSIRGTAIEIIQPLPLRPKPHIVIANTVRPTVPPVRQPGIQNGNIPRLSPPHRPFPQLLPPVHTDSRCRPSTIQRPRFSSRERVCRTQTSPKLIARNSLEVRTLLRPIQLI